MRTVFADSFYFFALLNHGDQAHNRAVAFTSEFSGKLVTTGWVLTEVGDGLAKPTHRRMVFVEFWGELQSDADFTVVPASDELLRRGIELYGQRLDKEWSLTDCISFSVMHELGLTEAATGDHHFEQAGFTALLK
jgi:predicted nucleic acid-binding protein